MAGSFFIHGRDDRHPRDGKSWHEIRGPTAKFAAFQAVLSRCPLWGWKFRSFPSQFLIPSSLRPGVRFPWKEQASPPAKIAASSRWEAVPSSLPRARLLRVLLLSFLCQNSAKKSFDCEPTLYTGASWNERSIAGSCWILRKSIPRSHRKGRQCLRQGSWIPLKHGFDYWAFWGMRTCFLHRRLTEPSKGF